MVAPLLYIVGKYPKNHYHTVSTTDGFWNTQQIHCLLWSLPPIATQYRGAYQTLLYCWDHQQELGTSHRLHNTFIAQLHETDALLTIIDACNNTHDQLDPGLDQMQELWRGCSRVAGHMTTLQTFLNMTHLYQVVICFSQRVT